MKIDLWGKKFVSDDNHFAEYDVDDTYSKLIVVLVNKLNILKDGVCNFSRGNKWGSIDFIRALNEYLNYNVENFDDFTISARLVDIDCGDIKLPIYILKSLNEKCNHQMIVVGEPGEIHYLLKENETLLDAVNNNQGLISFSIKSGEELFLMKNYINSEYYIKEEYTPGFIIKSEVFNLKYIMKYDDIINKKVCESSAFKYPEFFNYKNLMGKICVYKNKNGRYEIDIRDCDGRPEKSEIRDGDSVYSVYYQYMVEKGYFIEKGKTKVKK